MIESAGLPDVAERQKPNASNAGLERDYLNMSAVSLSPGAYDERFVWTGSQKTSYSSPKERKMAEESKHDLSMLKPSSCFPIEKGQSIQSASSSMRGNATTPIASPAFFAGNHIVEVLSERTA
jgi:hypothetical protein